MTLQERYEKLLQQKVELTDKQQLAKMKMLYMRVLYELAVIMKSVIMNKLDDELTKSLNTTLNLMLENCIIQNVKPELDLDSFHHWPIIKNEKGYTIATYLDGYSTKQFVSKEPITFIILIKQLLNIDLQQ